MKLIENFIYGLPKDHILREVYDNRNMIFANSFLHGLETALFNLKTVEKKAYDDFVLHKLRAAKGNSFDMHSLISSLCELGIMNSFIKNSKKRESFAYEPKLRDDNNKNVEFTIVINRIKYNIEVKSPNFEHYNEKLNMLVQKHGSVMYYETRMFDLTKEEKAKNMTATDSKVKDFLLDANNKFPFISGKEKEINILFICWNDNTDQPCTALKYPLHGLLTKNSWYKDAKGKAVTFDNIDFIFISDLYQNILVHMLSGEIPLPGLLTGVPYFERNERFMFPINKLNPFILPFSRNVLIKPEKEIDEADIFNIPIAFSDQYVQIVDEAYVSNNCNEIKISYL
ncbi:MAG: hypothetical protein P4L59_21950 [Desulfosporosinus sp.]|nr:hypothetical protein [Desulfosporosinus sp.]